eukprot:4194245-Pyramimonas_sp.AAC.1
MSSGALAQDPAKDAMALMCTPKIDMHERARGNNIRRRAAQDDIPGPCRAKIANVVVHDAPAADELAQ